MLKDVKLVILLDVKLVLLVFILLQLLQIPIIQLVHQHLIILSLVTIVFPTVKFVNKLILVPNVLMVTSLLLPLPLELLQPLLVVALLVNQNVKLVLLQALLAHPV